MIASRSAISAPVMETPVFILLTGVPGIGKTTVIRQVAHQLKGRNLGGIYLEQIREDRGRRWGDRRKRAGAPGSAGALRKKYCSLTGDCKKSGAGYASDHGTRLLFWFKRPGRVEKAFYERTRASKARFSELVKRVPAGDEIVILRERARRPADALQAASQQAARPFASSAACVIS
jgi:hypothetical protein